MNRAHFEFDMIAMGDVLVAFGNYVFEMINLRYGKKWEIIQMDRTFWRPCVTKWDDENIIAIGGSKNVLGDDKRFTWVSCTNINLFQVSFSNSYLKIIENIAFSARSKQMKLGS